MHLFIPACGDRLTLTKPWTFSLFLEHRNLRFARERKLIEEKKGGGHEWDIYEDSDDYSKGLRKVECLLPKGTCLEVDRVYIRTFNKSALQEGNDYDSITFKVVVGGKAATKQRFWVKLSDANNIDFTQQADDLYRNRVKLVKQVLGR